VKSGARSRECTKGGKISAKCPPLLVAKSQDHLKRVIIMLIFPAKKKRRPQIKIKR